MQPNFTRAIRGVAAFIMICAVPASAGAGWADPAVRWSAPLVFDQNTQLYVSLISQGRIVLGAGTNADPVLIEIAPSSGEVVVSAHVPSGRELHLLPSGVGLLYDNSDVIGLDAALAPVWRTTHRSARRLGAGKSSYFRVLTDETPDLLTRNAVDGSGTLWAIALDGPDSTADSVGTSGDHLLMRRHVGANEEYHLRDATDGRVRWRWTLEGQAVALEAEETIIRFVARTSRVGAPLGECRLVELSATDASVLDSGSPWPCEAPRYDERYSFFDGDVLHTRRAESLVERRVGASGAIVWSRRMNEPNYDFHVAGGTIVAHRAPQDSGWIEFIPLDGGSGVPGASFTRARGDLVGQDRYLLLMQSGGADPGLERIDPTTGVSMWKFRSADVSGGSEGFGFANFAALYAEVFGFRSAYRPYRVARVDRDSGRVLWSRTLIEADANANLLELDNCATADGDAVSVQSMGYLSNGGFVPGGSTTIVRLAREDGTPRWLRSGDMDALEPWVFERLRCTPNGALYATSRRYTSSRRRTDSSELARLDPLDGSDLWRVPLPDGHEVAATGDLLYRYGLEVVERVNPADGSILWTSPLDTGTSWHDFARFANGDLFVASLRREQDGTRRVRAERYSADTGARAWFSESGPGVASRFPSARVIDDNAYVSFATSSLLVRNGAIAMFRGTDGALLWSDRRPSNSAIRGMQTATAPNNELAFLRAEDVGHGTISSLQRYALQSGESPGYNVLSAGFYESLTEGLRPYTSLVTSPRVDGFIANEHAWSARSGAQMQLSRYDWPAAFRFGDVATSLVRERVSGGVIELSLLVSYDGAPLPGPLRVLLAKGEVLRAYEGSMRWTCVIEGSGNCERSSGAGDFDMSINLESGSKARIAIDLEPATPLEEIRLIAQAHAPFSVTEVAVSDNQAEIRVRDALFANSFE